jgi:hypothetical protein
MQLLIEEKQLRQVPFGPLKFPLLHEKHQVLLQLRQLGKVVLQLTHALWALRKNPVGQRLQVYCELQVRQLDPWQTWQMPFDRK